MSIVTGAIGVPGAQAQSKPPAEYPPASYTGKQYVDSKGCVYIRAGVDGNVNWVPRVSRSRKQLCGYKPTAVAGATSAPNQSAAPELITIPTAQQPAATTPAPAKPATSVASSTPPAAPAPTKPQRPSTTSTQTSTSPAPVKVTPTPTKPTPQPVATAPAPRTTAPAVSDDCAGVSEISRQYMNDGARCGPQAVSPVTYGTGSGISPQSSLRLTPNTRVVPTHVYQDRRHSQGLTAPAGYRTVWSDDRLNLQRAERTLKPAVITGRVEVPAGYVLATRDDDRLNTQRALRTAQGNAQTDMIWTHTVPRELVPLPVDRPIVTLPSNVAKSSAEADEGLVLRLSTRSAPDAPQPRAAASTRRYVRAGTYADPAAAQAVALGLAAKGLPVRLGSVTRRGQVYKVVLAGPYTADSTAQTALNQVRAAGYSGARLSK